MHFTDLVLASSPPPGEVVTTLDLELQLTVERLVREHVAVLAAGGLTNAAVVVVDPRNGAVQAMVGSTDYWRPPDGAVNGATSRRQPGSTLKPFAYALAFDQGLTPATVEADVATALSGRDGTLYRPANYDGQLAGPVLLADALGRSLNVPAVRLLNRLGVGPFLTRLHALGFHSLDQPG